LNFVEVFGIRKLESLAIVWRCLHDPTFTCFSRTPTCDKQTDAQTHDYGISLRRASRASRGKK